MSYLLITAAIQRTTLYTQLGISLKAVSSGYFLCAFRDYLSVYGAIEGYYYVLVTTTLQKKQGKLNINHKSTV